MKTKKKGLGTHTLKVELHDGTVFSIDVTENKEVIPLIEQFLEK